MTRFSKILTVLALAMAFVFSFASCTVSTTKGDLTLKLRCESTVNGSVQYIPCLDVAGTDSARVYLYDESGYSLYGTEGVTLFFENGTSDIRFDDLEEGRYSYKVYIYGHDGSVMYQNEGESETGIYWLDVIADQNNVYDIYSYYNEPATTGSLSLRLANLRTLGLYAGDIGYVFWAVYDSNDNVVCEGKKLAGQLTNDTITCPTELYAGLYSYEIYVTDSFSNATDAAGAWADTVHLKAYNNTRTPAYLLDVRAGEDNVFDIILGLYP